MNEEFGKRTKTGIYVPGQSPTQNIDPSEFEPLELLKKLIFRLDQIDMLVGDIRMQHGQTIENLRRENAVLTGRLNSLEAEIKGIREQIARK